MDGLPRQGLAHLVLWRNFVAFMDDALILATADLLEKNWSLVASEDPSRRSWEALHAMLKQHLADLLAHDFARLVNIMYRLDVPEQRFRTALAAPTLEARAHILADAVLARERLRAEMRVRYSPTSSAGPQAETNPS